MNLINKAIIHEIKKGVFFYNLIQSSYNLYIKKLFVFLKKESEKHHRILENVLNKKDYKVYYSDIYYIKKELDDKLNNTIFNERNSPDIILINKAIKQKKESQKFYLKKSIETLRKNIKNIFLYFADDEYNHFILLEFILNNINKTYYQNVDNDNKYNKNKSCKIGSVR